MTDKQINATIHDALGNPKGCPRCNCDECAYNRPLNYCADLNAMHEAEKTLTDEQCVFVRVHLRERLETHAASRYTWHATAQQRAEAFLKALGKWDAATEAFSAVVKESFTTEEAE